MKRITALLIASALAAEVAAEPLDCFLEPRRRSVVSAPVIGVVDRVDVEPGDLVSQGQVLARLESSVERATVKLADARAKADATLREAETRADFEARRLERSRALHKRNVISDHEIDEVTSANLVAQAALGAAREARNLSALELSRARALANQRTIKSPFDALVVRQLLSEGEYADPPQIFEIVQIDPLRVEVFAPVSLLGRVKLGGVGWVSPQAPVGGRYRAEVVQVDPIVDPKSATFRIKLELPNPENAIAAGLRCTVDFELGASEDVSLGAPATGR